MADPLGIGAGTCELWLDAGAGSTISATAGAVDTWSDRSGNARNATASTTARPTTGSRYLNGINVLDFDGAANTMATPSFSRASPFTWGFVFFNDSGADSTVQKILADTTNTCFFGKTAGNVYQWTNGNGHTVGTVDTSPHIVVISYDTAASVVELDGVVVASGINSGSAAWGGVTHIGSNATPTNFWNGGIAEAIQYSTLFTAAQRAIFQNYLYNKWIASPIIVASPPPAMWTPLTLKLPPLPVTAPVSGTSRTLAATVSTADGAFATTASGGKNLVAKVGTSASAKATKTLRAAHLVVKSPTADNTKAAIIEAKHYTAKGATSDGAKATSFIEAKHLSNKVTAATTLHTATITISGQVSFSGKISEAKTAVFRRVTPSTVSGLTRNIQGAAPSSTMVRPTMRRTVRRTGKMGTSSSTKAHLTYGRRIVAKSPASTSSKASLDTTSTAQGNPPAIPSIISAGVPASRIISSNNIGAVDKGITAGNNNDNFSEWETELGFTGFAVNLADPHMFPLGSGGQQQFKVSGGPANVISAIGDGSTKLYDWQQAYEGAGAPAVNGAAYGTILNSVGPFVYKRVGNRPNYHVYINVLLRTSQAAAPPLGNWWDDVQMQKMTDKLANQMAGSKFLGGNGLAFDTEPQDNWQTKTFTSTTRPTGVSPGFSIFESDTGLYKYWDGTVWNTITHQALLDKVESRGYQMGLAMWSAFPAANMLIYAWQPVGCPINWNVNPNNYGGGTLTANGLVGAGPDTHSSYWFGVMRAMKDTGATGKLILTDYIFYRPPGNLPNLLHGSIQATLAMWSQNLPAATRDYVMGKIGVIPYEWPGHDSSSFYGSFVPAATFKAWIDQYRLYSMFGMRLDYAFNMGLATLGQDGSQNQYYVLGHQPNMLASASTVSQDTLTVSGGVGTYQVTSVAHSANPQATVECELTATVINNTASPITNPGVGFYDTTTNNEVGFGAAGTGTLAPGASATYSTLTSPSRSGYIPAAAGSVTIRAKPGANGVDSNSGVIDQTFTVAAAPPPPPVGTRLWADASPWNTVKNQTGIVFAAAADAALSTAPVNLNFDFSFNHPTYFASVSDHLVTINLGHSQIDGHTGGTLSKNAPAGMQPATGGDNVMFIQFTDGTYIDGYAVIKNSDTNFTFQEYVYSVDAGHGTALTATGFGDPNDSHRAGTTGIGSAQAGGTLLKRDVQNGSIPHGIFIAGTWDTILGDGAAGTVQVPPAINNDISGHHGPVPEGGLMLIPTATAMPASLTAMEQQLFTALKTYGAYCCDTTAAGNFYVVYSDGSAECNAAFTGSGVQTVCHLLRLVKTW